MHIADEDATSNFSMSNLSIISRSDKRMYITEGRSSYALIGYSYAKIKRAGDPRGPQSEE